MTETVTAYISLGSNLGDRNLNIKTALKLLNDNSNIDVTNISDIIETPALGDTTQPKYLNTVAGINTSLTPQELLKTTSEIESKLGRTRNKKWSPRTIDIDIVLYGDRAINTPDLIIPHSQMHLRSFVLNGLCQLNPKLIHPVLKKPVYELAERLNGCNFFLVPDSPQLISIAGIIGVGKTTLTEALSKVWNCRKLLEPYSKNPFMSKVYAGCSEFALDSEIFFLTQRILHLNPETLKSRQIYISDYVLEKGIVYADCWLKAEQANLYKRFHTPLIEDCITPSLVIYMYDTIESCLAKIHKRNRPYEQKIEHQFLETLNLGYEKLFSDWKKSPLIRLDASKFNCLLQSEVENFAKEVKNYIAV